MTTNGQRRAVHLLGSVPLGDAEQVFRQVSEILGPYLRSLPDGEQITKWIGSQINTFSNSPYLESVAPGEGHYASGTVPRRFRLRSEVDAGELTFDELGYARIAKESYGTFVRLKSDGAVPEHLRFQVSLPTPLAPVATFCEPSAEEVFPAFEAAMLREVDEIVTAIPHDQLAMQ
ncbi:MAG: hypothetical protein ACREX8_08755, partial [Gammaproteobacteria bacterium]